MNRPGRLLSMLAALLLIFLSPGQTAAENLGSLRIRCFKIGKADAYLLRTQGHAVLIDAGEEDDGPEIVGYLEENGISSLDCLILTHFDKRSIGGVPELLLKIPVQNVLVPVYEKESNLAVLVRGVLESHPLQKVTGQVEMEYDGVRFTVIPAKGEKYLDDEDNDFSLVVSVTHGENKFFFAGDIMSERIAEMAQAGLLTPHTVLKMPCHGQDIAGLGALLDAVKPQIAIIPCSVKNPPAGAVISDLDARGIRWYATMNGSVTLTSDGYQVTATQNRK
jgi:competence protein ComEC